MAKTLARQYGAELRRIVGPLNFGLNDRCGTDAAIHYLRYLVEANPDQVIMSIDGVGAYDHVSRTRMFE